MSVPTIQKKKRSRPPSEDQEQVAFVRWARNRGIFIFHIPNGMFSDDITGARFKRLGTLSGIPDLCLIFENGKVLWVEMKTRKKGVLSPRQKFIIETMEGLCQDVFVAYGAKEAMDYVEDYYGKKRD